VPLPAGTVGAAVAAGELAGGGSEPGAGGSAAGAMPAEGAAGAMAAANPYGAAAGAAASVLSAGISGVFGGTDPSNTNTSTQVANWSFGGNDFNVSRGSAGITTGNRATDQTASAAAGTSASAWPWWVWTLLAAIPVVGLAVWRLTGKR
jgi:hypothetical protein